MRQVFYALVALMFSVATVSAEAALNPLEKDTRHQVPPLAGNVDIPLQVAPDTAKLGFALVAVKGSSAVLPVNGWSACIARPTGNMPFHSLRVSWPAGLPADDYDLSFAVWEMDSKGVGFCSDPKEVSAPDCTANSCSIESIKIGLTTSGALLHVQGARARTVTFDPSSGDPDLIMIPVAPAPWLESAKNLRIRLVDETVEGKSQVSRFNLCVSAQGDVPTALVVKPESRDIPVGTTKLTAHLWLESNPTDAPVCAKEISPPEDTASRGEQAADTNKTSAETDASDNGNSQVAVQAPGPGYNPAACQPDAPVDRSSCQKIELTLTRPKATLKKPATFHFEHEVFPFVDWVWLDRKQKNDDWQVALVLTEPGNQVQLEGLLRGDLKDGSGNVSHGSIQLKAGQKIVSGGEPSVFRLVLDPPDTYGSFDAAIPLVGQAGTMAEAVLPVKVLLKMPVWVLPLVIFIGVAFGFLYRLSVQDRVPLYEMRAKIRNKIDSIVRQAEAARDDTLKQNLLGHASRLSTGFHNDQLKATELETLLGEINTAVEKSISDHGQKLTDLRQKLDPWLQATRLDAFTDDLLGGKLKVFREALDLVKTELDADDATSAAATFEKALMQTPVLRAQFKDWLSSTFVALPGLLEGLGAYSGQHNAAGTVQAAQAAFQTVDSTDAAKFGNMLSHAPALEELQKGALSGVGQLLDDLYDIDDRPDLANKPANLGDLISEIDSARNQGFNVRRLRKTLLPLAIALPDLLNTEQNWTLLAAGAMPSDPVTAPADQSGVAPVLSRLQRMMVAQFGDSNQPSGDQAERQVRFLMPAVRQGGYHLSRPVNVHFGEEGSWRVVTEAGPEPTRIEWLVNGKKLPENEVAISINPGQEDVLRVQATLKFSSGGKDVVLVTSVMPTGLRGWEDPAKVKSRVERAQGFRTLMIGIVTVFVGTFTLGAGAVDYGTLLTGLFFGLGADLTAGSISSIRQNAKNA